MQIIFHFTPWELIQSLHFTWIVIVFNWLLCSFHSFPGLRSVPCTPLSKQYYHRTLHTMTITLYLKLCNYIPPPIYTMTTITHYHMHIHIQYNINICKHHHMQLASPHTTTTIKIQPPPPHSVSCNVSIHFCVR